MTDLEGKVAVVTGASRGLGQRAAVRLAVPGAAVILVARGKAALAATAQGIVAKGGRADVSDPASLDAIKDGLQTPVPSWSAASGQHAWRT